MKAPLVVATAGRTTPLALLVLVAIPFLVESDAAVGSAAASTPGTTNEPTRIGDVARGLSAQEVFDLVSVVETNGGPPWLLFAQQTQVGGSQLQIVHAYGPPTVSTPELRRGFVVFISRTFDPITGAGRGWALQSKTNYAQVALAGRDFARIEGEQDGIRPFIVRGTFSDTELIALVRLIRLNPSIHELPISHVTQEADGTTVVFLHTTANSGYIAKVRWEGARWRFAESVSQFP